MEIQLVTPFPEVYLPAAWDWLQAAGDRIGDDTKPLTIAAFVELFNRRRTFGLMRDGQLGGLATVEVTPQGVAAMHGYAKRSFWGRQTTGEGLRLVCELLFGEGVRKISACIAAGNRLAIAAAKRGGFREEGYLRANSTREGQPVDAVLLGLLREEFYGECAARIGERGRYGAVAGPVFGAIGKMGAAGPAIAKTLSMGLAGYFGIPAAKQAGDAVPEIKKAFKEGRTDDALALAGGAAANLTIAGTALWHGTKTAAEMVIPESRESYYERQYAKPPYQRDPGVDWRSGIATPENGAPVPPAPPQRLLGSGSPGEPPPPPPDYGLMPDAEVVEHLKAAQASGDQGALGNILGEVHRRMAARQQTPAQPATPPQPSDTVLTPDQAEAVTTVRARQIAEAMTRPQLPAAPEQAPRVLVPPQPQGPSGEAIPMPGQLQRALPAPPEVAPAAEQPAAAVPQEQPAVEPPAAAAPPAVTPPEPPVKAKGKGKGKPAAAPPPRLSTQDRYDRREAESRQLMIDAGVDPDTGEAIGAASPQQAAVPAPPPGFELVKETPDATTVEQPAAPAVEESQSSAEESQPSAPVSQGKRPAGSAAERGPAAGPATDADAAGPGLLGKPATEPEPEVLNYKRGSDTAQVIVRHDPEKGYSAEADHSLSGFSGGSLGGSGYEQHYPTREAALDAMAQAVDITTKLGLGNGGGPKTLPNRVAKMQAWFDGFAAKDDAAPAAAPTKPPRFAAGDRVVIHGDRTGTVKEYDKGILTIDPDQGGQPWIIGDRKAGVKKTDIPAPAAATAAPEPAANPDSPLEKSVAANRKRSAEIKAQFENATYGDPVPRNPHELKPGDRYFDGRDGYITVEDVHPTDPKYPDSLSVETSRGHRVFDANKIMTVERPHAPAPAPAAAAQAEIDREQRKQTPAGWDSVSGVAHERHPSVDLSDDELNSRAKNAPLPIPTGEGATRAADAWGTVSRIVPELAGKVKSIGLLPAGSAENAAVNPQTGVLRVHPDRELTPESLWHELIHLDQPDAKNGRMALDPDKFNSLEAQAHSGIPDALRRFASHEPLPANVEQEFAARHKDNLAAARKRGYVDADPEQVKKTLLTLTQQLRGGDSASASVGDRDVAIHRKKEWEGRGKKRQQVVSYTGFLTKPGKQTINYTARDPEAAVYWATEALHSLGVRPDFWDDYKYGAGNRSAERLVKTGEMLPNTESGLAASDAAAKAIGQPKMSHEIYSQAFGGGWKPGHAGMTFADVGKAYADSLPRNESALLDHGGRTSSKSYGQADPAYSLVQAKEPGKGYSDWENQVEDYERAAKGHAEDLKNIRRKIATAKQLNGGSTPRIAESEKVFDDLEAKIKKNLAHVKEQAKQETAKDLADTREKVRPLAEAYAKYGEATFPDGTQRYKNSPDADSLMRRYARLKGIATEPLKQGGGFHQGGGGWQAVMKDLGIEPQKPPRRVEVPTTGKDKLTKAEVTAIESAQLGGDGPVPGDQGTAQKLQARGWIGDDYKLTPAGEAAVYSYRMDAEEAAAGKPISEYTPKKQATIPGMGETRYGNEATAWNTVDGDIWHTEGHGAWKGEFPRNWAARDTKKPGPDIAQVIAPGQKKGSVAPVKPIGFYTYAHKDGTSQNVVFDNGAVMSAVNYDYTLHRNGGEVSWRQAAPKSAFFGYDKEGAIVATVMPMKIEEVPSKLQQYLDPATVEAQKRTKGKADDAAELKRLKESLAEREKYEKALKPGEEAAPGAALPPGFTKAEAQARVAELEGKGKGPQLSTRDEEASPRESIPDLLARAKAAHVPSKGAQLVNTLRVNQEAADVLGHAYELGGGERMGAFDGAALTPEQAQTALKGLRPLFSKDSDLPNNAKVAAARIYGQLKKASGNGSRGVAVAMPGAESHEQLHFAVNQFKFDPDKILEHGPTRVAVLEARSRGFAKGSDERVIREVMTRIWAHEHGTLKVGDETADKIAAHFLENATPAADALDTLEGLAHENRQATIRRAKQRRPDAGAEGGGGEEPGPLARYRQEAGSTGGNRRPAPDARGETGEGPELTRRVGDFSRDERGSAPADILGLGKFVEDDVTPTLTKAATGIAEALDDALKVLAPQFRSPEAQRAGLSLRHRAAELARSGDQARAALADAKALFDKQPREDNYEFIRKMEAGEKQPTPELEAISKTLRELFDSRRADVQALGTGKLRKFYEHYFPHIWEDPKRAAQVFASLFGRRPIEGSKAFLKQRTHITFQDGLNAGLTPVSDNPVDLALLKIREMDRYIMAHRLLNEWKGSKLARFVDARNTEQQQGMKRAGWRQITDPIGTVYGPSVQQITEFPNEGLWNGLQAVAEALDLKQERGFLNLHGAVGRAQQGAGRVQTLHGTAEDVLAHEIGHQIDWLAGSGKRFVTEYPDPQTVATLKAAYATTRDKGAAPSARTAARKTIAGMKDAIQDRKEFARQLRALADLRGGDRSYTHKREEKMALLAEMWVGSRESFKRTAPKVFKLWKEFLNDNPKLHALRDIEGNTEVLPLSQPYDVGGLVIKGHWWAPDGAARILDNYLSPGLRSKSGAYRVLLGTNNVLNQAQLGVSAFHLGFTSADAAVSKGALAIEQGLRGQPIAALKSAAAVPTSPVSTWLTGRRVLAEWNKAGSQSPEIAAIVDALVKGGGRAHMDEMYQTHIGEKMLRAFRTGNLLGGLLRAPFAGLEALSDITMRHVVPAQKLGVFADLARHELERLGPGATESQVRDSMAKVWDSVENRMGQMTYDNLFWDRTAKDLAMINVRSVGWNLGTVREIGGAGIDAVRIPIQAATGKKPFEQANLHRLAYVVSLAITSAVMGAIYQYLATGKGPEELKDYFFPKTGELDEAGRPQRASMPTYAKDVYHYATEPGKTMANKVSPIDTLVAEMVRNEDFYHTKIRNEDDPLIQQMLDAGKHVARSAEPFGIRNLERETKLQAPLAQRVQQFVGITPAPAALERTKAEQLASELAGGNIPAGSRTKEEAERRTEEHTIRRLAQLGKPTGEEIGKALRAGTITIPEARRAIHDAHIDPLARSFKGLGLAEALKVWSAATPDERKRLRPLLLQKGRVLKEKPAAERAVLLPKLVAALQGQ